MMPKGNCEFKGTGGQYFVAAFIHLFLLTMITFGLYGAWAWVRVLRLKASHTVINGRPVSFTGTGGQLFVLWLINGLVSIITLGLYSPWAVCRYLKWRAQKTVVGGNASQFIGTGGSLFILFLIHLLILPLLTFGLYSFIGYFKYSAWRETNTKYGGERTTFGGGFGGFFGILIVGGILNSVTFYLFMPWFLCWLFKWQIEGLAVGNASDVRHFPSPKVGAVVVAVFIIIGIIPILVIAFFAFQFGNLPEMSFGNSSMGSFQLSKNKPRSNVLVMKKIRKPISNIPAEKKPETAPPEKKGKTPKPGKKVVPPVKKAPDSSPAKKSVKPRKKTSAKKEPPKKVEAAEKKAKDKKLDLNAELSRLNKLISESKEANADFYYNRGWIYASKGQDMKAIEDYEKAIKINSKYADAYFNRGLLYVKLKRYEVALRDFNRAVELNPKAYDALCNSGNVYYELKKYRQAIRDYTRALEIRPGDADLYKNRGFAYKAIGDDKKANADREKAARLKKELDIQPAEGEKPSKK
jgi:uncharacterized membrane protein YjgN (DUF898 family)/Flp pilus assembly protein TadD